MDDEVHGRRAAIYADQPKRLPKSFYLGLGIAVAIHAGLAYYLIQQNFAAIVPPVVSDGDVIKLEPMTQKLEKPKPAKAVPPIHATPTIPTVKETLDAPPQKPDVAVDTKAPITELPPTVVENKGPVTTKPDTGTGTDVLADATWARFPNADTLADYYPPRAMDGEIEGKATVQCAVVDTSGRVSCVTISESPGGYGFGQATVRMIQDKGRVDMTKGNVAVGSILRQTVAFHLG